MAARSDKRWTVQVRSVVFRRSGVFIRWCRSRLLLFSLMDWWCDRGGTILGSRWSVILIVFPPRTSRQANPKVVRQHCPSVLQPSPESILDLRNKAQGCFARRTQLKQSVFLASIEEQQKKGVAMTWPGNQGWTRTPTGFHGAPQAAPTLGVLRVF